RGDIVQAAARHNVDISDLLAGLSPANGNGKFQKKVQGSAPIPPRSGKEWNEHDELKAAHKKSEQRAVATSIWTEVVLIGVTVGAGAFFLLPRAEEKIATTEQQIAALNNNVNALGEEVKDVNMRASFLRNIVPEKMEARLDQ